MSISTIHDVEFGAELPVFEPDIARKCRQIRPGRRLGRAAFRKS